MTNITKLLLGGGMLLATSACGGGDVLGVCQRDIENDPDCLPNGQCAADTCLADGTCTAEQTKACYDAGSALTDGKPNEACLLGDIQLDPPSTNPVTPGDPDCGVCEFDPDGEDEDGIPCTICEDPTDQADDTCCLPQNPNQPYWCDPKVPDRVIVNAITAYDPATNAGRSWFVNSDTGDVEQNPYAVFQVQAVRFETTNNPAFVCQMIAEVNQGTTLPIAQETRSVTTQATLNGGEDTRDYPLNEFTFKSGEFTVEDFPITTQAGEVPGCNNDPDPGRWYVDPAQWPDGLDTPVSAADWRFGWSSEIAPVIEEIITQDNNNDPNDDYDRYDLYNSGFIAGAGMGKPSSDAQTVYYAALGFAVGDDWKAVESGNEDDPLVRLPASAMVPVEGNPAAGIYDISSYNNWDAGFILLDTTPGG